MPRAKKGEGDVMSGSLDYSRLQEKIIENLVDLQKVHTNMAEKFDNLSNQITNLLTLFESAARSFAEHPANISSEKDKEFLNKIDKLLEQNKVLAKGLTMMEERIKERVYGGSVEENQKDSDSNFNRQMSQPSQPINRPLPKF